MFLRRMPHLCEKMKRLTAKDAAARKMLQDTPTPNFYVLSYETPVPEQDDDLSAAGPIFTPTIEAPEVRRISKNDIQQHQQSTPGNANTIHNMGALALLANRRCGVLVGRSNHLGFGLGEGFGGNNNTFMNHYLGRHQQDLRHLQRNSVLDTLVLLNNANSSGLSMHDPDS
jgi:hypothetical protein